MNDAAIEMARTLNIQDPVFRNAEMIDIRRLHTIPEKKIVVKDLPVKEEQRWSVFIKSPTNPKIGYRVLNPIDSWSDDDKRYQRLDVQYKLEVAEKDTLGLTPRVYAYDPETGTIEMEVIEGTPLSKYHGALSSETISRFLVELKAFHAKGLYHGDLSAVEHWILTPEGRIRLIDPTFTYIPPGKSRSSIQLMDLGRVMSELKTHRGYVV